MSIQSIGNIPVTAQRPVTAGLESQGSARQPQASQQAVTNPQASTASDPQQAMEELKNSVKAANEFVSTINASLSFSIDHDTGKTVVKVVDSSSQEVIKQIPSEEMLAISKALDQLKGLLVQQKA